jgi:hypothetical protein
MDSSTERLYLAELKLYRRKMGDRYRDSARCSVTEFGSRALRGLGGPLVRLLCL